MADEPVVGSNSDEQSQINDIIADLTESQDQVVSFDARATDEVDAILNEQLTPSNEVSAERLEELLNEPPPSFNTLDRTNPIIPKELRNANHGESCGYCERTAFIQCYMCMKYFCPNHMSSTDRFLCLECSMDKKEDPIQPQFEVKPLVGPDGVTHKGKHITPIGDTYQVNDLIQNMSDDEVMTMLGEYQQKVKEAERLLTARVITVKHLENVVSERSAAKKRAARAARVVKAEDGSKTIQLGSPVKASKLSATATSAKDTVVNALKGMTADQRAALLKAIQAKLAQK